jgi:two-component system LytT family response regulator
MKFQALSENLNGKKVLKRLILRTAEALQLISVSEIIRAEADSNYTHFYLEGERHIIVSRTIREFESLLAGSGFLRVHQSHLVSLNHVDRFLKRDSGSLQLKNGKIIPVSPNLKQK